MRQLAYALVIMTCLSPAAHADDSCGHLLTTEQTNALRTAYHFGNSYEVLTGQIAGKPKTVAIVGESTHLDGLSHGVGPVLYDAFDRTAFSFRRKMGLDDRLFGRIAATALTILFKTIGFFDLRQRAESDELLPPVRAFLLNPKPTVPIDPARMPFTEQDDLVNNPFYEVHDDRVLALSRIDLHDFMDEAHERNELLKTANLERGFRPKLTDWVRTKAFSLNLASYAAVGVSSYVLPPSFTTPLAVGWVVAFTWQVLAVSTHGYNARPWYRYAFPFMYVGDDRRNETAVLNIISNLAKLNPGNLAVVIEQRRISDLRDRLLRLGFKSVDSAPADDRWMYRNNEKFH